MINQPLIIWRDFLIQNQEDCFGPGVNALLRCGDDWYIASTACTDEEAIDIMRSALSLDFPGWVIVLRRHELPHYRF